MLKKRTRLPVFSTFIAIIVMSLLAACGNVMSQALQTTSGGGITSTTTPFIGAIKGDERGYEPQSAHYKEHPVWDECDGDL